MFQDTFFALSGHHIVLSVPSLSCIKLLSPCVPSARQLGTLLTYTQYCITLDRVIDLPNHPSTNSLDKGIMHVLVQRVTS